MNMAIPRAWYIALAVLEALAMNRWGARSAKGDVGNVVAILSKT